LTVIANAVDRAVGRADTRVSSGTSALSGVTAMGGKITVHDPRGYPPKVTGKRLANRLESLDGKIVYLIDCLFENSDNFMEQLRQWFAERLPSVITRIIKPRVAMMDDPDMRATIAAQGNAAIIGVGL